MMDKILRQLEQQIKCLIQRHNQLKKTSFELIHDKYSFDREKELILNKQNKVISQIESLLTQLQALEKLS